MKRQRVQLIDAAPESNIAYCARVSNPNNQENPDYARLLRYCIDHGHWSVFEMATMTVGIYTSRAISAQIGRHHSLHIQEFSQRYSEVAEIGYFPPRKAHPTNRQLSTDDLDNATALWWAREVGKLAAQVKNLYQEGLRLGIAKESARFVLPMASMTTLYVSATVRDWIHYLKARLDETAQQEHREVARDIQLIFCREYPLVAEALGWRD